MKIKQLHYDEIKSRIDKLLTENPNLISQYQSGDIPRADKVNSLQVRFNFDMYHAVGGSKFSCDHLYDYLNDTHIATALNKICPKVVKKY